MKMPKPSKALTGTQIKALVFMYMFISLIALVVTNSTVDAEKIIKCKDSSY